MRKFSFLDYTGKIYTVNKNLRASIDTMDVNTAFSAFSADVQAGKALPYNTGNALPDFDFAEAKAKWDELTTEEQKDAFAEWHEFLETKYEDICDAFADGPEAIESLVEAWKNR